MQTNPRPQAVPIMPVRSRRTGAGGFVFVPSRLLRGEFFAALSANGLALHLLLVLVADRQGSDFYHEAPLLCWPVERYIQARDLLVDTDHPVASDGTGFLISEFPRSAPPPRAALTDIVEEHDPATIRGLIERSLSTWQRPPWLQHPVP